MLGCLLYAVLCGCAFSMFETYIWTTMPYFNDLMFPAFTLCCFNEVAGGLDMLLVCLLIVSLMQCSLEPSHTGPFSQQLNLVLSLITILVVLVCGCKASLVLVQLCGHALRRTSWRGNIRSMHAKLKLLADMVLLFATMDNQQWLQWQPKFAQDVVLLL